MLSIENFSEIYPLIAESADICMKPWKHSVVNNNDKDSSQHIDVNSNFHDLILRIECRSVEGIRFYQYDLDVEIYPSGKDICLMISLCNNLEHPILWQGKHSFWMDSETGNRCNTPGNANDIELFARRLMSLFLNSQE